MGMNKRLTALALAICLLLCAGALAGCKGGDNKPTDGSKTQTTGAATTAAKATDAKPTDNFAAAVTQSAESGFDYFNNTVFVGDSVSLKLQYYVERMRESDEGYMGNAQFLCSGSLGSANALWDISSESVHPTLRGEKMKIEDAIPLMNADKVYIMLGMNDVALYGPDDSVENMKTLLQNIRDKSPDIKIIVQSATPRVATQTGSLNNTVLKEYDDKLAQMCAEQGYYFVDVASVMRDESGALPLDYCSDPDGIGVHFTDEACAVWIDYLRKHTV